MTVVNYMIVELLIKLWVSKSTQATNETVHNAQTREARFKRGLCYNKHDLQKQRERSGNPCMEWWHDLPARTAFEDMSIDMRETFRQIVINVSLGRIDDIPLEFRDACRIVYEYKFKQSQWLEYVQECQTLHDILTMAYEIILCRSMLQTTGEEMQRQWNKNA